MFSAKIIIDKYDGTNTAAKLSGAKFVLRCKSVTETTGTGTKPTTIFYIVGGLLVIGAAVILVARRKAHD